MGGAHQQIVKSDMLDTGRGELVEPRMALRQAQGEWNKSMQPECLRPPITNVATIMAIAQATGWVVNTVPMSADRDIIRATKTVTMKVC